MNGTENFDYTGNVVCAYLQKTGHYKLEVWGAQGYMISSSYDGTQGYGGYSYGTINAEQGSSLYVVVGGAGQTSNGGYNGGGSSSGGGTYSGGGGATHISVQNCGELKNCSSYKGTYDSSLGTYDGGKILIVAGGGGGGLNQWHNDCVSGHGGGIDSGGTQSTTTGGKGGSQTAGGACYASSCLAGGFGYGGGSTSGQSSGGGGGWYGGGTPATSSHWGAGGGSGYIGNSLLKSKGMYCYYNSTYPLTSCTVSTNAATYTTRTTSKGQHLANTANNGNGYARITYLGT